MPPGRLSTPINIQDAVSRAQAKIKEQKAERVAFLTTIDQQIKDTETAITLLKRYGQAAITFSDVIQKIKKERTPKKARVAGIPTAITRKSKPTEVVDYILNGVNFALGRDEIVERAEKTGVHLRVQAVGRVIKLGVENGRYMRVGEGDNYKVALAGTGKDKVDRANRAQLRTIQNVSVPEAAVMLINTLKTPLSLDQIRIGLEKAGRAGKGLHKNLSTILSQAEKGKYKSPLAKVIRLKTDEGILWSTPDVETQRAQTAH